MNPQILLDNIRRIGFSGLGAPALVLVILAMVVIPLPPMMLDLFFTFNIALSLVILLVVIYTMKPLDFGVFPSVLLIATLLRLALNVASTRIVLLDGHNGGAAAGKVIEAFGEFVIGGNYAVGLVVFLILVIINFVVVTKGAGRVSEVAARFTLDAMPGKQMAIDADLNAGLMTQEEARARREEVTTEANFYGAMDGASKFVRGDAIAGIMILFINIIGGLAIGVAQHGLLFAQAMQNYSLLTIGDGLVAQIPSLLLSTAAAILVTRVSATQDVGSQVAAQLLSNPRALMLTAGVMALLGLVPGMPNLAFLGLAAALGYGAWVAHKRSREPEVLPAAGGAGALPATTEQAPESRELSWDDVQPVDVIGLEVGYRLIPLVDRSQDGQLMTRIKGVRKKLSQELGFLVQPVHIRDNLDLAPTVYRISLHGVVIAEAEVYPDRELAINPGKVFGDLQGIATRDPAFGLEAAWIETGQREHAQALGYTIVDASTVVATHLSELVQRHAAELLGHEEVQQLIESLEKIAPKLVEDLTPKTLSLSVILKVLQNLLLEQVPIRDMRTIAETLAEHGAMSQDPAALTGLVRVALSRGIIQQLVGSKEEIPVIVLEQELERLLLQFLMSSGEDGGVFEPGLAERLRNNLREAALQQEREGNEVIVLVVAGVRAWLAHFMRHSGIDGHALSYDEIPDNRRVKVIATIGQQEKT